MLLILLGVLLFPIAFLDSALQSRDKKLILFLCASIFIILGGIRWNTGTDWNAYYFGFLAADTYSNATGRFSFEWGYSMLNYLIHLLGGDYSWFLVLFTFMKVAIKMRVFVEREFLVYGLFSLFLYYCYTMGDIVTTRQSLAVSFTLLGTLYIRSEKFFMFLLCCFLAFLVHKSALIFFFAYFIYARDFSRSFLTITFLSSMVVGLVLFQLDLGGLLSNIPGLNAITSVQEKINTYSQSGQVTYGEIDSTLTIIFGYIKKLFVVVPILINLKLFKQSKTMSGLVNIVIFGSVIYFILGSVSSEFKRINSYFEIYEIFLIPYLIYNIKVSKLRGLLILIYSTYAFLRLISGVQMFWDLYDPFLTIFDEFNYRSM